MYAVNPIPVNSSTVAGALARIGSAPHHPSTAAAASTTVTTHSVTVPGEDTPVYLSPRGGVAFEGERDGVPVRAEPRGRAGTVSKVPGGTATAHLSQDTRRTPWDRVWTPSPRANRADLHEATGRHSCCSRSPRGP